MLPKLFVAPWSFLRVSSHGGARLAAVASLVGGVVVAVLAPHAIGLSAGRASGTSPAVAVAAGDTQVVFGPRVFATPNGNATTYVERFAVAVQPARRYTLRLVNGAADGTKKATGGTLILNGRVLFGGPDFASGATLNRIVEVLTEDTIQVTVQGQGTPGAFVTVTIFGDPDPTFTVFAERFTRSAGPTVTDTRTFTLPAGAAPPYYLHLVNGNVNGTSRMATGSLTLNGVLVATGGDINQGVAGVVIPVTLQAQNTFQLGARANPSGFLDVRFTATDTTRPTITITSPAPGLITRDTLVTVAGSVQDQTATSVAVNGQAASMTGNAFSLSARLAAEGQNTLHIVATDAAGHTTDSVRTVIRDTQQPVLTVSSPANNAMTKQTSITVSGTVTDQTAVTVNANGVPLPVDGAGQFTGQVPLAEGQSFVTVTATDAAGNAATVVRSVTRDTQAPVLTVTAPTDAAVINADHVTVTGSVTDATAVTVTANGTSFPVAPDHSFSGDVALAEGANTIAVVATDAATNSTTVSRSVTRQAQNLPPDPATVATPNDPTVATNVAASTAFLYTGPNPIQTGVAPGTIAPVRAAVVRGKVLTRDGHPLSGVKLTILNHSEFGQTLSRSDGMFDLAVNGGGLLTVNYEKSGFLPAQRPVAVPWQDFVMADDAALVPLDPQATVIDFSQPAQTARGSVVTDSDGTRQATLMFEQGTTASMVLPDSSTQPLSSITVRATEYTVGTGGRKAMPGPLPPTSAYTYAVEVSADEAIAAGATTLQFSKAATLYVENFLGFPVGSVVPVGFYDHVRGVWAASDNGVVLKVISTNGGIAAVDVAGDDQPADSGTLANLGMNDAERQRLAQLYQPGQTLWRVRTNHLTPLDANWVLPPTDAKAPEQPPPDKNNKEPDNPCPESGNSVIGCESQILSEALSITGTPFSLQYQSDRVPGRKTGYTIDIPLSGDSVPASLKRIQLTITIAGRQFIDSFPPAPHQRTTFTWDGFDAYGRPVVGQAIAVIEIGYVYPGQYGEPPDIPMSFGVTPGTTVVTSQNARRWEFTAAQFERVHLGVFHSPSALGGWGLNVHHGYDPVNHALYLGDGSKRTAEGTVDFVSTVAGNKTFGYSGDGGPATQALLAAPIWAKVAPDGSLFIADQANHRIRRISPNGIITTVAGNGQQCSPQTDPCGDGGPAVQARLRSPTGLDLGPDGSLYVADQADFRIRRVRPDGVITTVAGTGVRRRFGSGPTGDGGPATQALLAQPVSVALGRDGSLYITDDARIRRIGPEGFISTVAGNDSTCESFTTPCGEGGPATHVAFPQFSEALFGLAIGADGSLYFSQFRGTRLYRVTPDGILRTFAGTGNRCNQSTDSLCGDGGPAIRAPLQPWGMAFGPDGGLYVAELARSMVRRIGPDGTISTVAGPVGVQCFVLVSGAQCGDGSPALAAHLGAPSAVAPGPGGSLYVVDLDSNRVRKVASVLPGFKESGVAIASEDGSELYQFDASGRHLRTIDALTGSPVLTFQYDSSGRLTGVLDRDSLRTTVERRADGLPTALVAPFGQRTVLATDANGYLSRVLDPANDSTILSTSSDGLVAQLRDPVGGLHSFSFDSLGRLTRDEAPGGGVMALTRVETDSGFTVSMATALGRTSTYGVQPSPNGGMTRAFTTPTGLQAPTKIGGDRTRTITYPDGHVTTTTPTGDPRFSMQAPAVQSIVVTTPAGLRFEARDVPHVTLSDAADPLSMTAKVDTILINGRVYTSTFDRAAGALTRTSPEGHAARSRIDGKGRLLMARAAGLDSVVFAYDARGLWTGATQGDRVTRFTYDSQAQLDSLVDPLGHAMVLEHDQAGRVSRQALPDSNEVRFAHDRSGNITSLVNPRGLTYRFTYNSANLLDSLIMPSIGAGATSIQYSYDVDRRFTRITRPDGSAINFAFDPVGRPSMLTVPEGAVRYAFDSSTGNLASVSAPNGTAVAFTYDGGLPVSTTWTGTVTGSIQATYNNELRTASMAVTGSTVMDYQYDGDARLVRAGPFQVTRGGPGGRPSATSLGSVTTSEAYSSFGELSTFSAAASSTALYAATYTRDPLGRVATVTEAILGDTSKLGYGYDARGRLMSVTSNGGTVASYEYDQNGNRVRFTGPAGVLTGAYDARDQLISYGGTAYSYSPNGEVVRAATATDTTWYSYNTFGSLVSAVFSSSKRVDYVLDPANRRIGKKVNGTLVQGFLYQDQFRPVAELDSRNNLVSRFVYGTRPYVPDFMIKNGVTYRIIADQAGSVRLVVNTETGEVAQRLDYDEFGHVTRNTSPGFQPFGFGGGLYDDDTKLVHFGAREYDAFIGRWTSQDPGAFVGGTNLHAYTGGDPVNFGDPSGLDPCECSQNLLKRLDADIKYDPGSAKLHPVFTPDVADRLSAAIRLLNSWNITPQINSGYRTDTEQSKLAKEPVNGLPACDPRVKVCPHPMGYSVDIDVRSSVGGSLDTDQFIWDAPTIISVMAQFGFEWAGTKEGTAYDPVHFDFNSIKYPYPRTRETAKQLEDYFNRCLK